MTSTALLVAGSEIPALIGATPDLAGYPGRHVPISFLGLAIGMTLGLLATGGKADATAEPKELERLTAALERIRDNFVDTFDQSDLVDAAIKGMLGLLDTQSEYLDGKFFR